MNNQMQQLIDFGLKFVFGHEIDILKDARSDSPLTAVRSAPRSDTRRDSGSQHAFRGM
jgi:hypothetical protein